jgi:hypothetical protein
MATKVKSGGDTKVFSSCAVNTRGSENSRGKRVLAGVKTLPMTTDQQSDQSPEGEAARSGANEATRWQENVADDKRERAGGKSTRLIVGGNP